MPARLQEGLPHYYNSQAGMNNYEPVYLNQFEVVITPPLAVDRSDTMMELLIEQVKDIKGLPEITPTEYVEQKYLWATRTFSKPVPEKTTAILEVRFEVNLNDYNQMYTYETLRSWAELQFDPFTGKHGIKRDYAGEITVLITNKNRQVFRQYNFKPVYLISPFNSMDLDYLSDEIYVLTAKFMADAWRDKRPKSNVLPERQSTSTHRQSVGGFTG